MQRQGQDTLWNLLRRVVSRRTKRYIKLMIKKEENLDDILKIHPNWTKVDNGK